MAYESQTYETILARMMARVTEKYPNLDTREGSILFNALAPAALELAIMYTELDNVLDESFVDTASREYLLRACEDMGMDISVFEESAGVFECEIWSDRIYNTPTPSFFYNPTSGGLIGTRWNCDLYNYVIVDTIDWIYYPGYENGEDRHKTIYKMVCETPGVIANKTLGDLTPIEIDADKPVISAKLAQCLVEGRAEVEDDKVREAYREFVGSSANDGNVAQYKRWCNEYVSTDNLRIGKSKIFPLWNGANTVKVSILSDENRKADEWLIYDFQKYLDPDSNGMGDGVAPIGAIVTVSTATEIPINISATIKLKEGHTAVPDITAAIETYFSEIAYEKSQVSYMSIGAIILAVEGVDSISNLTINGGTADVALGAEEIPIVGTTEWTVG